MLLCVLKILLYFCRGFREGDSVPFFISMMKNMIRKEHIAELAEAFLKDSANYLIDVNVRPGNRISVFIENDEHVSIKDCIALSRHIEFSLDREQQDFELEVSSPGIDSPLKLVRQFQKYIGKEVESILLSGDKIVGTLLNADAEGFEIEPKKSASKKKANPNNNETEPVRLLYPVVKETRLVITF